MSGVSQRPPTVVAWGLSHALRVGVWAAGRGTAQLFLIVSGSAGSGKSHMIHAMLSDLEDVDQGCTLHTEELPGGQVHVGAPTGTAAFNVGGLTLHYLLSLPVQDKAFASLSGKRKKNLERRLRCGPSPESRCTVVPLLGLPPWTLFG